MPRGGRTHSRRLVRLGLLLVLAVAPAVGEGVSRVVEYRSPLDDSIQAYGVYLPESPPPDEAGYPAVLHGHGYGWRVSTSFSSFQRQWAEEHGWVLIHLNARGPNFYEGVGDIETLRVVEDAIARFGLDRDRIYMTGGSMGGTGALRQGLRHPDVFAAVMGVDGWTDFRLWHHHWYARTDCRDLIEEFRRPLLQAASPLYWAERGRWGAIGHIVDGGDSTVLPENGLRLWRRLSELYAEDPAGYDYHLIFNPTLGHGRGTDYRAIYGFFVGRRRIDGTAGFRIQTPILPHGRLYWGRIEDLLIEGLSGSLEVHADGENVAATTENLQAFTLYLAASPLSEAATVRVYADGFPCYQGPPETVTLQADTDAAGAVVGWRLRGEREAPYKRPEMCGPVGQAFLSPFVIAWATAGEAGEVARHRIEAQQFARSWNDFMVHAPTVEAVPEDELSPADLASSNIVLFGSLDSSRVLRRADALFPFPVRVREDGVVIRDLVHGDRRYIGEQFGALMCYPNPLAEFATYLVVANRRLCMKTDGGSPQLLGYDLEKLPWAYPDYIVFNTDQSELPFVLNVNNKPPVTCYEAAYFVEAGFFDDRWGIDRAHQLRRVRRQKPEHHRFVHVDELSLVEGKDAPVARVRITDASGEPVHTARVTGRWWGDGELVASASTDEEGHASFPAPAGVKLDRASFEVVNVMATGCSYDWVADRLRVIAPGPGSPRQLGLALIGDRPAVAPTEALELGLKVWNCSGRPRDVEVCLSAPAGDVLPGRRRLSLGAGEAATVAFSWRPLGRSAGRTELRAEALARDGDTAATAALPVEVRVLPDRELPIAIAEVSGSDIDRSDPWQVKTTIRNFASDGSVAVTVHCALMEARRFPAAKRVEVPPGETAVVRWCEDERLDRGEHTFRVSVEGGYGITATGSFAVR